MDEELNLFSLDNDFFFFQDHYKKKYDQKTVQISEWNLIRFGVAINNNDNDLDEDDWDDNDFIENQVGISITYADIKIGNEKFNLIGTGDGKYALCKDLLYERDDYSDDLTAFAEVIYTLNPNLFNEFPLKDNSLKDELINLINKFDTKGKKFWKKKNACSPNNLEIPFQYWLISALTLTAKDSDENWIKWLTGYPHDLEENYFYEDNDSSPIAEFSPGVFMICSHIDDSEGEFTFKEGLFSLNGCDDKFDCLEDFFGYVSDNSHVVGLTLAS